MNELSWIIYAADVAGRAGWLLGLTGFACLIGGGFAWSFAVGLNGEARSYERRAANRPDDKDYPISAADCRSGERTARRIAWPVSICAVVFLIGGVMTPSRDTLYAIAASEIGESVLNSETGGKAVEALNAWLDRQINKPEPVSQ